MSQQPATSMFLRGPFAPVGREIDAVELQVDGQIPRDLNGTLFRAGPNPQFEPLIPSAHHWFDGDGMVHALTLQEGRASYRNRWVHTAAFLAERRRGTAAYGSFMNGGTPAPRMTGFPPLKNPGNTNVTVFDGRLLVFCEGDLPHSLGVDTLETHGQYDFHGDVSGVITAHFKIDPRNGDMLFFGAMGPSITWYRASNDGRLLESHAFLTGVPCFIHDFAVTEGYAIFFINPSIVDIEGVFEGRPSTIWNPEIRNRIAVMSRDTGKVQWIEQDETFAPDVYKRQTLKWVAGIFYLHDDVKDYRDSLSNLPIEGDVYKRQILAISARARLLARERSQIPISTPSERPASRSAELSKR